MRNFALAALLHTALLSPLAAQDAVYPPKKPSPAKIETQFFVVGDPVVQVQWPHTLKLVNAPQNVTLLNPGQCIRVGILATGDDRDDSLAKTKVSFQIKFAGQSQAHSLAPLAQFKQIKPEGGDFVTAALAAASLKNPLLTMVSLGVTADSWCVPADAADGEATVEAEVESPSCHQALKKAQIQIESFETGSKRPFKDAEEVGNFFETYYRQPNAARLIPALQCVISAQRARPGTDLASIAGAFLTAALKADPRAAKDFQVRVMSQEPATREFGLAVLRNAGYDIDWMVRSLGAGEQDQFRAIPPLANPYDLTPTQALFAHLDLMWVTFGATGRLEPVQTIASTLSWRADYDEFDKLRKSPNRPSALTPSIARGVAYMAAGWSLGSFQRSDPLVADYIDYLLASPDVSPEVKSELNQLSTNPAFKREEKK